MYNHREHIIHIILIVYPEVRVKQLLVENKMFRAAFKVTEKGSLEPIYFHIRNVAIEA